LTLAARGKDHELFVRHVAVQASLVALHRMLMVVPGRAWSGWYFTQLYAGALYVGQPNAVYIGI